MDKQDKAVISPRMIGSDEWTMVQQPVQSLLHNENAIYLIMNFYRQKNVLPQFGITTLPAKDFFWQVHKENKPVAECAHIAMLKWKAEENAYWNGLVGDYENPVVLRMWRDPREPKRIMVMLEHYGTSSSVYKFHSCPVTGDAYLVFLTSVGNFINKNTNRTGQMSLLSEEEYLNEYGRRLVNSLVTRRADFSFCLACTSTRAEIVLMPCGHAPFCAKCCRNYKGTECPLCKTELYFDLLLSRQKFTVPEAGAHCLACPPSMNCTKMDCMLQPCGCVVGCLEYVERSLAPKADNCPNCGEEVETMMKVFAQTEGTE